MSGVRLPRLVTLCRQGQVMIVWRTPCTHPPTHPHTFYAPRLWTPRKVLFSSPGEFASDQFRRESKRNVECSGTCQPKEPPAPPVLKPPPPSEPPPPPLEAPPPPPTEVPPPPPTEAPKRVGECSFWGDPHIVTFDGARPSFYSEGEYYIAKSKDIDIQGAAGGWAGCARNPGVQATFPLQSSKFSRLWPDRRLRICSPLGASPLTSTAIKLPSG